MSFDPTVKPQPPGLGYLSLELSGPAQNELSRVLQETFPGFPQELDELMKELDAVTLGLAGQALGPVASSLVTKARAGGWDGNLLLAARALRPGSPKLRRFTARYIDNRVTVVNGARNAPIVIDPGTEANDKRLERIISDLRFIEFNEFHRRFAQIGQAVCSVEVREPGALTTYGTGFLVGPDVVLTNYHVVESVVGTNGGAACVKCRFDFLKKRDGTSIGGLAVGLARDADFPTAWARWSEVDVKVDSGGALPAEGELDYALLKLERPLGDESVLANGTRRGFLAIREARLEDIEHDAFVANQPMVIIQHPSGDSLRLAIDTQAVVGLNANKTRLRYRTNTEGGSSGSPCFTMRLEPIALHHAGDPDFSDFHKPTFNEGIPLSRVVKHIEKEFPPAADLLG